MIKIYLYKDRKGEHRWRIVARNGRILADCGEGYRSTQARNKGLVLLHLSLEKKNYTIHNEAPPKKLTKRLSKQT